MGRRWRRDSEDLRDVAYEAARTARAVGDAIRSGRPEDFEALERQREARRERRRQHSLRQMMSVGVGLLAGGLAASLGLVTPAAVGVGILAAASSGAILRWAADIFTRMDRPRPASKPVFSTPRLDPEGLADGRAQLVQSLIDAAAADLARLEAAAAKLADAETRVLAGRLVAAGQRLAQAVAAAPEKLAVAQRAFTYHLPKAVYLAETLAALEAAGADEKRRSAARHVLARMENLFEKTALDLANVDAREMDVELRLISQALDEDLDKPASPKG